MCLTCKRSLRLSDAVIDIDGPPFHAYYHPRCTPADVPMPEKCLTPHCGRAHQRGISTDHERYLAARSEAQQKANASGRTYVVQRFRATGTYAVNMDCPGSYPNAERVEPEVTIKVERTDLMYPDLPKHEYRPCSRCGAFIDCCDHGTGGPTCIEIIDGKLCNGLPTSGKVVRS